METQLEVSKHESEADTKEITETVSKSYDQVNITATDDAYCYKLLFGEDVPNAGEDGSMVKLS